MTIFFGYRGSVFTSFSARLKNGTHFFIIVVVVVVILAIFLGLFLSFFNENCLIYQNWPFKTSELSVKNVIVHFSFHVSYFCAREILSGWLLLLAKCSCILNIVDVVIEMIVTVFQFKKHIVCGIYLLIYCHTSRILHTEHTQHTVAFCHIAAHQSQRARDIFYLLGADVLSWLISPFYLFVAVAFSNKHLSFSFSPSQNGTNQMKNIDSILLFLRFRFYLHNSGYEISNRHISATEKFDSHAN